MANVSSSNGLEKHPKLRFKGFSEPWEHVKLSDFVSRVTRKNSDNKTDIPLTISSKDGLINQNEFFSKQVASKDMSGYYLLQRGEFAYNKSYSVGFDFGSIKRLEKYDQGALSTLYICFTLNRFDSDFIKHYFDSLKWYREIYMISAEGARNHGLLNVPTEDFFTTLHTLPMDMAEQKKIAEFLDLLTAKIEKQQALVDNLKKYKRGVLEHFVTTFQSNNANFVRLKEITQIYDGTHQTPNYKTHGVKFVSVENIESLLDTRKFISKEDFEKEFKISPSKGDVLMTRIGDIGRSAYVDFDTPIAFYVSLALFKCKNQLDGRYLAHYIMSNAFQEQLWKRTLHIAFPKKINTCEIGECEILLPSLDDQSLCAKLLDSIDLLINKNQKTLEYLITQRLGILQQIFI